LSRAVLGIMRSLGTWIGVELTFWMTAGYHLLLGPHFARIGCPGSTRARVESCFLSGVRKAESLVWTSSTSSSGKFTR